jgi:hypothetical protein
LPLVEHKVGQHRVDALLLAPLELLQKHELGLEDVVLASTQETTQHVIVPFRGQPPGLQLHLLAQLPH